MPKRKSEKTLARPKKKSLIKPVGRPKGSKNKPKNIGMLPYIKGYKTSGLASLLATAPIKRGRPKGSKNTKLTMLPSIKGYKQHGLASLLAAVKKPKRKCTQKQLDALAAGRAVGRAKKVGHYPA